MADETTKDQKNVAKGEQAAEAGNQQAQEAFDVEQEQGFRGIEVDPTPNEHYTLEGVNKGLPTPETDPEYAHDVEVQLRGRDREASR